MHLSGETDTTSAIWCGQPRQPQPGRPRHCAPPAGDVPPRCWPGRRLAP